MNHIRIVLTGLAVSICVAVLSGCPPRPPRAGDTRTFEGIQFQWCPAGTFQMGSPEDEVGRDDDETQHTVTLTEGFWLSTFEVKQDQWLEFMESNPSSTEGDNLPVDNISWEDVQVFLVLLNAAKASAVFRLPTEAQWEYAYRAGTATRFYWGEDFNGTDIDAHAWFSDNSGFEIHPVGEKGSNAWGLYDMSGNVSEFCQDYYGEYPEEAVKDPEGPDTGEFRIVRGGGFFNDRISCRAAVRERSQELGGDSGRGFRLLRIAD
ncbi:MAG: formylglycine-generating enzyme family protein [Candidatus Hydrogenedentes bacterium]|nr:formylglycine-generating enzyme family protein [Candidatus Hydrogenedentota bacterium]